MDPTWLQKLTKIVHKSMPRYCSMLTSLFNRFQIDFCSLLDPPNPIWHQRASSKCVFSCFLRNRCLIPFWCQLGSILVPKIHQNPRKNRFQEASKKCPFSGSIFCPSWLHFGTQVGTQEPLKTVPKRLPKTFSNFPRRHQDSSRVTRASKIEIWSIFGPKIRWGTSLGLDFRGFQLV